MLKIHSFKIKKIPRSENSHANALTTLSTIHANDKLSRMTTLRPKECFEGVMFEGHKGECDTYSGGRKLFQ